jgi:hypothetical protein
MAQDYTVTVRDALSLTMLVADQIWRTTHNATSLPLVGSRRSVTGIAKALPPLTVYVLTPVVGAYAGFAL